LFSVLVGEAGLGGQLTDPSLGQFTIFAPTDQAFDLLPVDSIAQLRADPVRLARVVSQHIVNGQLMAADLTSGPIDSLDGSDPLDVVVGESSVTINSALIISAALAARNGVVHAIDTVLVPADVVLAPPSPRSAVDTTLVDGQVVLTGIVASEAQRAGLASVASSGVGPVTVLDQLDVDSESGLDAATFDSLIVLVEAMSQQLVSGSAGFDGAELYASGEYATDAERDLTLAAAESVGVVAALEARPVVTVEDATNLEAELNAFVLANPILFESGSAVLTENATTVVDQIAALVLQVPGVSVTVDGHTDSDGAEAENQRLSEERALAVRAAIVASGVNAGSISAFGFGSGQPVLVNGVEDKLASRRVEFKVVPAQ
jgi:outer membrane protein OmpA-like peptidoglycan-associated protein